MHNQSESIDDTTSCCREASTVELHPIYIGDAQQGVELSATTAGAQGAGVGQPEETREIPEN